MWSVNYIVARISAGVVEPHLLALMRWSMAFCLMLPFAWRELADKWPDWKREWPELILLGALGMWVCGAFVYIGGKTTEAINIGLLYALAPVMIAVASARLFDDRLRGLQILGAGLSLTGALLIVAKGSLANLLAVKVVVGDLWVLFAVCCWTIYSLLLKRQPSVLGPFARLVAITAGGVVVLIPFTIVETGLRGLPADWPHAVFLGVLVAVFPGFGAYQSYSYLQSVLGVAKTGLVLYLGPLYGAAIAWAWLGEKPQWFHWIGALFILPGMYLATRPQKAVEAASRRG